MPARLVCFVVYGQNPNSGTTNMIGATALARKLKAAHPGAKTCFVGSHTSALPLEVLVAARSGFRAAERRRLCAAKSAADGFAVATRQGQGHRPQTKRRAGSERAGNRRAATNAWTRICRVTRGICCPYKNKPLDLYRAHFWHAEFNHDLRTPFAAIYTSLGCKFKCDFCMINIVNRTDNADGVVSANSPNMRFWSPAVHAQGI